MKNKIAEMFENGEKVEVKWAKTKRRGSSFQFTQCWGKVIDINGEIATVKQGSKTSKIPLSQLRLESEKGQLTEFVENLAAAK